MDENEGIQMALKIEMSHVKYLKDFFKIKFHFHFWPLQTFQFTG